MPDIQMLELRTGQERAELQFDALDFDDLFRRRTIPDEHDAFLRLYVREHAQTPTVGFIGAINRVLTRLTRPESAIRTTLARTHVLADAAIAPRWFVYRTRRATLEPMDPGEAYRHAVAMLRDTQEIARQGDVIVEIIGSLAGEAATTELMDQVWHELEAADNPPDANPEPRAAAMDLPMQAAVRRREAFLALNWPTSNAVGTRLGANTPAQRAADLRAAGRLLGAWAAPQRTYVHPDCQFDREGQPLPVVRELLQILPTQGDEGGWRRTFWLYGPREALGGRAPADLLATDPGSVLELARKEFAPLDAAEE